MRKGKHLQTVEFPYVDPQIEIIQIPEGIPVEDWPQPTPVEVPADPGIQVPAESPFGFPVPKKVNS